MTEKEPDLPRFETYRDPDQPPEAPEPVPPLYPSLVKGALAGGLLGAFFGGIPNALALMSQNAAVPEIVQGALLAALVWGSGAALTGMVVGGLLDERRRRQQRRARE